MDLTKYEKLSEPATVVVDCSRLDVLEAVMKMADEKPFDILTYDDGRKHLFPAGCDVFDALVTSNYDEATLDAIFKAASADPAVLAYMDQQLEKESRSVYEAYGENP